MVGIDCVFLGQLGPVAPFRQRCFSFTIHHPTEIVVVYLTANVSTPANQINNKAKLPFLHDVLFIFQ